MHFRKLHPALLQLPEVPYNYDLVSKKNLSISAVVFLSVDHTKMSRLQAPRNRTSKGNDVVRMNSSM